MESILLLCAVVIVICIVASRLSQRLGVPALLLFLALGMLFGSDGLFRIPFDNFEAAERICSVALIFIMFYGGFGTRWEAARPAAARAVVLSTLGVAVTALLTALFCHFALGFSVLESFLTGAVISSTDAASVFSILRSKKLGLRNHTASLLEVESGSNDPFAYMMTMVVLSLMSAGGGDSIVLMIVRQLVFGVGLGFGLAKLTVFILKRIKFEIESFYLIFVTAIAILSYALCESIGGNGYLCVYIVGIVVGNSKIVHKRSLVRFFDSVSWLMQIMLFFTLGLLSFPSHLPSVLVPGILVSLFLILVARPVAVFGILCWFKRPVKQQLLVSWVGLRGAASIVFAIMAVTRISGMENDLFHMVFFVALFSVAVQGTLIPFFAKKLDLVEESSTVLKTFTDYQEETGAVLKEYLIEADSVLANKTIADADIPEEILVVMIKRGEEVVVPKGSTEILPGDKLVLSGGDFDGLPS